MSAARSGSVYGSSSSIEHVAALLRQAETDRQAIDPVRNILGPDARDEAYAVQRLNVAHAVAGGRRVIGRKIGLTNVQVQQQLGVDEPDFGTLFADMVYGDEQVIPMERTMQPKAEAEIALVLKHGLDREDATLLDIIHAIDYVLPAIEVVGSRIANWNIRFVDTVADNASSSLVVLGAVPTALNALDLKQCDMQLTRNGELVSSGSGAACLGHPLNAAVWLARKLSWLGQPMQAGDVVLTGALGPMVPISAGDHFEARISAVGTVRAQFGG